MAILFKGPVGGIVSNAQLLHPVYECVHVLLAQCQVAMIRSKKHFAEQALHFIRILFPKLYDPAAGVHTAVINQYGKISGGRIESGKKIRMIRTEPLCLKGFERT